MTKRRPFSRNHANPRAHSSTLLSVEVLEDRNLLSVSPLGAEPPASGEEHVLVQYQSGSDASQQPIIERVTVQENESLDEVIARYQASSNVLVAEPDYQVSASLIPNDPLFNEQFALNNTGQSNGTPDADIDAVEAWEVSTGSHQIVVAVIDSGIDYRHVDLYENIWINQGEIPSAIRARLTDVDSDGLITFVDLNDGRNQGTGKITDQNGNGYIDGGDLIATYRTDGRGGWANGISEDGDSYVDDLIGWNFVENNNDPFDNNGHGTHVSGIIGASGNNNIGVAGVLHDVQLAALKFLDSEGTGFTSDAVAAFDYATNKGIKISNSSWTLPFYSASLESAILRARSSGHIVVAAAGNQSQDLDAEARYPAAFNFDNVVTVAATSRNDRFTLFSNYGPNTVELAAPGLHIKSTFPRDRYLQISGTSMAAPYVTGALALVQSLRPDWSHAEVIEQVLSTVDPLPTLLGKTVTGGRLNLARALENLAEGSEDGPVIVSTFINGKGTEPVSRVRVTFDRSIDLETFTTSDIRIVGPGVTIPVTRLRSVTGYNDTKFDISFNQQTRGGTYTVFLGPDVRDLAGNQLAGGTQTVSFTIEGSSTFSSDDPPLPILDHVTSVSFIEVDESFVIGDLQVMVDIKHSADRDLTLTLRSPRGTQVVLVHGEGGLENDFKGTIFDDMATRSITEGNPPFADRYRSEQPLASFNGEDAAGNWQLWISDNRTGSIGQLNSWSLMFTGAGRPSSASAASIGALDSSLEPGALSTESPIITEEESVAKGDPLEKAERVVASALSREGISQSSQQPQGGTGQLASTDEQAVTDVGFNGRGGTLDALSEEALLSHFSSLSRNEEAEEDWIDFFVDGSP